MIKTKQILLAGSIVGTADITMASISAYLRTGMTPDKLLKYVASGIFGQEAMKAGFGMAMIGLMTHFTIAFSFTLFFFYIYPKIKKGNSILLGFVYGAFIWSVMAFVVLPLTNVAQAPFVLNRAIISMLILIFAIGLPLAFLAKRFSQTEQFNP
jgi:uncharacterized membrane protein YagU involved in acid resistance